MRCCAFSTRCSPIELCACNWRKGDPTIDAGELLAEAV